MNSYKMLKCAYKDDYRFTKFVLRLSRKLVRCEYGYFCVWYLSEREYHNAVERYCNKLTN